MELSDNQEFLIDVTNINGYNLNYFHLKDLLHKAKLNKQIGDIKWPPNIRQHLLDNKEFKCIDLINEIEEQLVRNNEEYKPFASDFTHCKILSHLYSTFFDDHKETNNIENYQKLKLSDINSNEKWLVLKHFYLPERDDRLMNEDLISIEKGSIFKSGVYYNEIKKQIVVAFMSLNLQISVFSINNESSDTFRETLINKTLIQIAKCYEIAKQVTQIANEKNCHLSFTGYSNGAWLAEYSLFFAKNFFNNTKTKAILFESPGIHSLSSNLSELNSVNYFINAPTFFNTISLHSGKSYKINIKDFNFNQFWDKYHSAILKSKISENVFKSKFLQIALFSVTNHMEKIKLILDLFNKETGQINQKYLEEVVNWPLLNVEFDKNSDLNFYKKQIIDDLVEINTFKDDLKSLHESVRISWEIVKASLDNKLIPGLNLALNLINQILMKDKVNIDYFNNHLFYNKLNEQNDDQIVEMALDIPAKSFLGDRKFKSNFKSNASIFSKMKSNFKIKDTDLLKFLKYDSGVAFFDKQRKNIELVLQNLPGMRQSKQSVKELDETNLNQFKLENKFKIILNKNYETVALNNVEVDILKIDSMRLNLDWCLYQLSKANLDENKPSPVLFKQLNLLKSYYKVRKILAENKKEIELIKETDSLNKKLTIEDLRIKMYRICSLNPDVKLIFTQTNLLKSYLPQKQINYIQIISYSELDSLFEKNQKRVFIYGKRGIGKSALSCDYGHYLIDEKDFIVRWFYMSSTQSIRLNYIQQLFDDLKINRNLLQIRDDQTIQNKISQKLNWLSRSNKILFIFDNVNSNDTKSLNLVMNILENLGKDIYVLINMESIDNNNQNFRDLFINGNFLELNKFNRSEATVFMSNSLNDLIDGKKLELVLNSFQQGDKEDERFLPITLICVLSLIKLINGNDLDAILKFIKTIEVENIFVNLFKILFQQLNQTEKLILINIGFMNSNNIKLDFIQKLISNQDQKNFENLFKYLIINKQFKLANESVILNVHEAIHTELKMFVKLNFAIEYLSSIYSENLKFFIDELKTPNQMQVDHSNFLQIQTYLNEFSQMNEYVKTRDIIQNEIECFNLVARIFKVNLKYEKAIIYYQYKLYENTDAFKIAKNLNSIANCYESIEDYEHAIFYYEKSLEQYHKIYNDNDLKQIDIAILLNKIGSAYNNIGQYLKGKNFLERSFEICIHLNESYDQFIIADLFNNIGTSLNGLKMHDLAIESYVKSLEIFEKLENDKSNRNIAKLLNNIGNAYLSLERRQKAISYLKRSLKFQYKLNESDQSHSYIAETLNNLGVCYKFLKNYVKSNEYFQKSLDVYKQIYASNLNQPIIALTLNNIGLCYLSLNDYKNSNEYLINSLEIYEIIFKENYSDNFDVAITLNNIGYNYKMLDDDMKAIEYFEKSLDILNKLNNSSDASTNKDIRETIRSIAKCYKNLECNDKAIEYYEKLLSLSSNQDESAIKSLHNTIANICYDSCKYDKAIEYYIKVYKSPTHPKIADTLDLIASMFYGCGNYAKSAEYLERSLEIYKLNHQNDEELSDMYTVSKLFNIGWSYLSQDNFEKALINFEKTLDIYKIYYSDDQDHPQIALAFTNISTALNGLKNYEESIQYLVKALKIYEKVYGENYCCEDIGQVFANYGEANRGLKNFEQAIQYLNKSLNVYEKLKEDFHYQNSEEMSDLFRIFGLTYKDMNDLSVSLDYFMKSHQILNKIYSHANNNKHPKMARILNDIGCCYLDMKNYELAIEFLEKSLLVYNELENDSSKAKIISIWNMIFECKKILIENKS